MEYLGIRYDIKRPPKLDRQFIPFGVWREAYLKKAKQPIAIAIERDGGQIFVHRTFIYGTPSMVQADYCYVERLLKFLLWSVGGFKVSICGCIDLANKLQQEYEFGGKREFDSYFFNRLYEKSFEVLPLSLLACPESNEVSLHIGGYHDGCRIGFHADEFECKVSAVIDGKCIYSEEVVWFPTLNKNPDYHYGHILEAFKVAASKMPRVDAIGVSSAGAYINNEPRVSSLFSKVPLNDWDKVKSIYTRPAEDIGDVNLVVANDGDVAALAGAMSMEKGKLMGLVVGTSEAVGYVDKDQNVLGWLNELAFAPVDLAPTAIQDEWSLDFGVGCKYFSQDAVFRLCSLAGIKLDRNLSSAEKLKVVYKLMENDNPKARAIFETIGAYLAYTVVLYSQFYDLDCIMLMGRVMSGKSGDTILRVAKEILASEYPELAKKCCITKLDEKMLCVGQSVAAASLAPLHKVE